MAGYRIVLNLTGNASRKIAKIAKDLVAADLAAKSLAGNLTRVSAASNTIAPIRSSSGGGGRSRGNITRGTGGEPVYTRHRSTRIASFGTGFNIGGFNGRLSTILQPDARGNIAGMNASKLMKGANIAALATSIVGSVAKTAAKVIGGSTLAPLIVGGGGLTTAIKVLQSEGFADGVRLISRRHQAKLGLGEDYERGQSNADFLAGSYGFDRSTTLSSINVLSGMGIGGTDRKLTTSEATGLTKVGGLISQQSGVSFERVMTNIQQLLVQTTPHIRDIREMLNQAPILGKYALKDMEEQGVTGIDARTWLKDQNNIFSALKRYELDLASNEGMQARGQIALAQQEFMSKVAGNNSFWRMIGMAGEGTYRSMGDATNTLMTTLAGNDSFKVMLASIETIFDKFGKEGATFIEKLSNLIDGLAQRFGLDGYKKEARIRVGKSNAIEDLVADNSFRTEVLKRATDAGAFKDHKSEVAIKQAQESFMSNFSKTLQRDTSFTKLIQPEERFRRKVSLADSWTFGKGIKENLLFNAVVNTGVKKHNQEVAYAASLYVPVPDSTGTFRSLPKGVKKGRRGDLVTPANEYAAYSMPTDSAYSELDKFIEKMMYVGAPKLDETGAPITDAGSSLTGMNRDRKALEIHFNAPIVEWNNTMETATPEETVVAVSENIEEIASAAIQKALLGASNKMSTQWY